MPGRLRSAVFSLLVVVVLAIPTATTLLLIHFHMDAQLSDFVPRNSDPLYHWRQIYTFSEVGFNGGSPDATVAYLELPFKSQYFMMTEEEYQLQVAAGNLNGRLLWEGQPANIYANLDADCDPDGVQ